LKLSEIFTEKPGVTLGEVYWRGAMTDPDDIGAWPMLAPEHQASIERGAQAVAAHVVNPTAEDYDRAAEELRARVSPDLSCTRCGDGEPAKVIVVTEAGGTERQIEGDKISSGLFGLAIYQGERQVAWYPTGSYVSAREERATLPDEDAAQLRRELDELRELAAEVINDASPSPALPGWIERAQALGVKGWDGDPIGASLSDAIEEQDL
jgi:hypothetical protein